MSQKENRKSWFQSEDVLAQDTVTNILSYFDFQDACKVSSVCKLWRLSMFNIQTTFDISSLKMFYPTSGKHIYHLISNENFFLDFSEKIKKFDFSSDEYQVKFEGKINSSLKYASIGTLIDNFIAPVEPEKNFKKIFISSFQSFMDFEDLSLILRDHLLLKAH